MPRPPRSPIASALVWFAVLAACGAPNAESPASRGAKAGPKGAQCSPSSVVTTSACAPRTLPPSNATSDAGCRSDAECTNGRDGRCVKNGFDRLGEVAPVRSPLFAEPPPPPPKTICTYDTCMANAECGASARCACGVGSGRNTCVPLDSCANDAECGQDKLCACGAHETANTCIFANCRTQADCEGGAECASSRAGTYCRTPRDTCATDQDCTARPPGSYEICDYDREARHRKCVALPLRPPG